MSTTFHTPAELSQALNQLVPAMAKGLTIQAGGHSLTLLPGLLADRLADELCLGLMVELKSRESRQGAAT